MCSINRRYTTYFFLIQTSSLAEGISHIECTGKSTIEPLHCEHTHIRLNSITIANVLFLVTTFTIANPLLIELSLQLLNLCLPLCTLDAVHK